MWPQGRFWTVPNILSLSRLALLPLFLYALVTPGLLGLAGALMAYGIASDVVDGYIARRYNQMSEWGRLIDPLADKVTLAAVLIFCYLARGLPLWILALIVARDLLIVLFAPVLVRRFGRIPPSNLPGRLAALSFALLAAAYVLDLDPLKAPLVALSVLMLLASSLRYARRLVTRAPESLHP